jgi:hypothetical protein
MKVVTAAEAADIFMESLIKGTFEPEGLDRVVNPETPRESPLEKDLEYGICKYSPHGTRIIRQYDVPTYRGTFRLDFVARRKDRLIGFECDGRQYHDWRRDIFRDAVILSETNIEAIYRIEGPDIYYRLETALYILGNHVPLMFSERGMENLSALSECRDDAHVHQDEEGIIARYDYEDHNEVIHHRRIHIRSLSRDHYDFAMMVDAAKRYRHVPTEALSTMMLAEAMKHHAMSHKND